MSSLTLSLTYTYTVGHLLATIATEIERSFCCCWGGGKEIEVFHVLGATPAGREQEEDEVSVQPNTEKELHLGIPVNSSTFVWSMKAPTLSLEWSQWFPLLHCLDWDNSGSIGQWALNFSHHNIVELPPHICIYALHYQTLVAKVCQSVSDRNLVNYWVKTVLGLV